MLVKFPATTMVIVMKLDNEDWIDSEALGKLFKDVAA